MNRTPHSGKLAGRGRGGLRRPGSAAALAVVVALGLLAGCGGDPPSEPVVSPLADCAGLTAPPSGAGSAPSAGPTTETGRGPTPTPTPTPTPVPATVSAGGAPLPAVTLPCFTGGKPFPLDALRGPAVVNLWGSWCAPCREELPVLQRYADRAAGQVHVVGVVTEDRRPAAASLAADLGITFPALEDRHARLRGQLGVFGLPITLLVDARGRMVHIHRSGKLDEPTLARLVAEHLRVRV